MLRGRAVTLHRKMDHRCVTTYSSRDGIVLWELPTTRVSAYRCGTDRSGWLDDAHPTVEDVEV